MMISTQKFFILHLLSQHITKSYGLFQLFNSHLLNDVAQKLRSEKVVADIARREGESAVLIASLSRLQGDLAVLDDLVLAVDLAHHSNGLLRERLFHHLQFQLLSIFPNRERWNDFQMFIVYVCMQYADLSAAVGVFADGVAHEDWVRQLYEDVVHAVDVQVLHPSPLDVVQNFLFS
jgi:hypothetical protein